MNRPQTGYESAGPVSNSLVQGGLYLKPFAGKVLVESGFLDCDPNMTSSVRDRRSQENRWDVVFRAECLFSNAGLIAPSCKTFSVFSDGVTPNLMMPLNTHAMKARGRL